jgi:hypothetical protein
MSQGKPMKNLLRELSVLLGVGIGCAGIVPSISVDTKMVTETIETNNCKASTGKVTVGP